MEIRKERREDFAAIHRVEAQAFGRAAEADLVNALREAGAFVLSLVALRDGEIVGHILFTRGAIEDNSSEFDALALAPLAVLPKYHSQGIGTQLMEKGLEMCKEAGHEAVFLLGHPNYYPRFGFVKGSTKGIGNEYNADDAFMVRELREGALDGIKGVAKFHPEFMKV